MYKAYSRFVATLETYLNIRGRSTKSRTVLLDRLSRFVRKRLRELSNSPYKAADDADERAEEPTDEMMSESNFALNCSELKSNVVRAFVAASCLEQARILFDICAATATIAWLIPSTFLPVHSRAQR